MGLMLEATVAVFVTATVFRALGFYVICGRLFTCFTLTPSLFIDIYVDALKSVHFRATATLIPCARVVHSNFDFFSFYLFSLHPLNG